MDVCDPNYFSLKIFVTDEGCPKYQSGDIIPFDGIQTRSRCPAFTHMIYPYMVTFQYKGWFTWMRDKSSVIVTCPGLNNRCTAMLTWKKKASVLEMFIRTVKGTCPIYRQDKYYIFNEEKICMKLYCAALPNISYQGDSRTICPGPCGRVIARIIKND